MEIKNKELSYRTLKGDSKNGATLSRIIDSDRNEERTLVQKDNQSEDTAVGGEKARDPRHETVRDRTTSFPVNLETRDTTSALTREGYNKAKLDMEREETKLLRIYREKCVRRDNEMRRKARIEHLKRMITEIPSDPEKIPDAEDREIELAIDEAEKQYNLRDESKKMFRIAEEVFDN